MAKPSIFLSHSSHDNVWCRCFVTTLQSIGHRVWFDEKGLYASDEWIAKIEQELQSSDIFMIVITPKAWASEWVRKEFHLAMSRKKRIVAVLHEETRLDGFIINQQMVRVQGQGCTTAARNVVDALDATYESQNFVGQLGVIKSGKSGLANGTRIEIRLPMSLGRYPDNSLVINSNLVAPHHARIYYSNQSLWVEDLNSSTGTFINGSRVKLGALSQISRNQTLTVGDVSFTLLI